MVNYYLGSFFCFILSVVCINADPYVANYTIGGFKQQDRFEVNAAPSYLSYVDRSATGYRISVSSDICTLSSFSYISVKFMNGFDGGILLRGNTPLEVENGYPVYRINPLTVNLYPGQEVVIHVPYDVQMHVGKGGVEVFNYVFSTMEGARVNLTGKLRIVTELKDNSLCMQRRVSFHQVNHVAVTPYAVYEVRKLMAVLPTDIPRIIQAPTSDLPYICIEWFAGTEFLGKFLTYAAADGIGNGVVRFPAYEHTSIRILPIGTEAGFVQMNATGFPLRHYLNAVTTSGTFKYFTIPDTPFDGWFLVEADQLYQVSDTVVRSLRKMCTPSKAGFMVIDMDAPMLVNRQYQRLV